VLALPRVRVRVRVRVTECWSCSIDAVLERVINLSTFIGMRVTLM